MQKIVLFDGAYEACRTLAGELSDNAAMGLTVAVSGGNTPKLLFRIMAEDFRETDWSRVRFFWVDERMVPTQSDQSNYGEFYRALVDTGVVSQTSLFPIDYCPDFSVSLEEYRKKIEVNVGYSGEFPSFDLVVLGVGEDGHTASIFPDNLASFSTKEIVQCVKHYQTGNYRITLSGSTLNCAKKVIFLCTGEEKSMVLHRIIDRKENALPATLVAPQGDVLWYIDKCAAKNLEYEKK